MKGLSSRSKRPATAGARLPFFGSSLFHDDPDRLLDQLWRNLQQVTSVHPLGKLVEILAEGANVQGGPGMALARIAGNGMP